MKLFQRTTLAWSNLTYRPGRLVVALAGVAFGVLLMFMQTGFRNALFDSTVELVRGVNADIVLVSNARYTLSASQTFDLSRVHMARSCVGVKSANPLYLESYYSVWRRPGHKSYPIRVLAAPLDKDVLNFTGVAEARQRLVGKDTALVDLKSRSKYGMPTSAEAANGWQGAELSGHTLRVVGAFELGTDFANDGSLIMSHENFERLFRYRGRGAEPLQSVDVGVIRINDRENVYDVKARLQRLLPDDVSVFTKQEIISREIRFWNNSTPVGFVFLVGTIMGFIIGAIICYQIIYSINAEYTREFATLKAMGYQPRYFIGLVLRQSLYLSLLGFLPGMIVSLVLYYILSEATGLLMALTIERGAIVLLLTVAMCALSGTLAMRRVLASDPADLF